MPHPQEIEKIITEFKEKFSERLGMLEVFWQNHGGEPFKGETIPEWLESVLSHTLGKEETVEAVKKWAEENKRTGHEFGFCKFGKHHIGDMIHDDQCGFYDQALTDLTAFLSTLSAKE